MIDPSIWADEDFGKLSANAQVMFIGMISNADDEGRLPGNSTYLGSTVFPYRGLTPRDARKIRDEVLNNMRSVILYEIDKKEYLQLKKFNDYQSIDRPTSSKYPSFTEESVIPHGTLAEDSSRTHRGLAPNRIEENRIERNRREENVHSKITDLKEEDFTQIGSDYKVPISFVKSKYDDLVNYQKSTGKTYKDYLATLRNWVKRDAIQIRKEITQHGSKRGIDARDVK